MDCNPETSMLKAMYEGLENTKVLYNPNREDLMEVLQANPTETLMCIGHGLSYGIYNNSWTGYVIDGSMATLFQSREVIGIWNYAKDFARKYGLNGFFTGMFVSNVAASLNLRFVHNTGEIPYQNIKFSNEIRRLIAQNVPLNKWVEILKERCDHNIDFVAFNYEAMEYYDGTQKPIPGNPLSHLLENNNTKASECPETEHNDDDDVDDELFSFFNVDDGSISIINSDCIETERLTLRVMDENDAADIFEIYSDREPAYWAGMEPLKNLEDARKFINNDSNYCNYGIILKGSDKVIGNVSISGVSDLNGDHMYTLGYAMSKEYRGNGYIPEAVKAVSDDIFSRNPEIPSLIVEIRYDNLPSQRVAEKCGFFSKTPKTMYIPNIECGFDAYQEYELHRGKRA